MNSNEKELIFLAGDRSIECKPKQRIILLEIGEDFLLFTVTYLLCLALESVKVAEFRSLV